MRDSIDRGGRAHADAGLPAPAHRLGHLPVDPATDEVHRLLWHWCRDYLCLPHRALGRDGPVCPYLPAALRGGRLHLAVWPGCPGGQSAVAQAVRRYRARFERLDRGRPHALLVAFPAVTAEDVAWVVDGTQRLMKTEFVDRGLMIGEFHPGPPAAAGLHNPGFRPLHSPLPLLAIRAMVRTDLPFLAGDDRHLAAYRSRFPAQD